MPQPLLITGPGTPNFAEEIRGLGFRVKGLGFRVGIAVKGKMSSGHCKLSHREPGPGTESTVDIMNTAWPSVPSALGSMLLHLVT